MFLTQAKNLRSPFGDVKSIFKSMIKRLMAKLKEWLFKNLLFNIHMYISELNNGSLLKKQQFSQSANTFNGPGHINTYIRKSYVCNPTINKPAQMTPTHTHTPT